MKATKNTIMVGNRPRGRPKGSKLKKKTSGVSGDTKSGIQEVSKVVQEHNTKDEAEQRLKKWTRKGTKNQPPEQLPEEAHERR